MANKHKSIDDRLKEVRDYAEKLKTAARWVNSQDAVANVENIKDDDDRRAHIYEFWCYLTILVDLKRNYKVQLVEGSKYGVLFPIKPGVKANYPFFSVIDNDSKEEVFQYCNGIKIKNKAKKQDAPDISFLKKDTGGRPDYEDCFMLYDAKFKHDNSKRVGKGSFDAVSCFVRRLGCESAEGSAVIFTYFTGTKDLRGNFLLTNGRAYDNDSELHQFENVFELEGFDINKTPKVIK